MDQGSGEMVQCLAYIQLGWEVHERGWQVLGQESSVSLGCTPLTCVTCPVPFHPSQEAQECLSDPEGRWMSFSIKNEDLVILEKKNLPGHIAKLDNLETPVTIQSLVCDLQDAGEVTLLIQISFSGSP